MSIQNQKIEREATYGIVNDVANRGNPIRAAFYARHEIGGSEGIEKAIDVYVAAVDSAAKNGDADKAEVCIRCAVRNIRILRQTKDREELDQI